MEKYVQYRNNLNNIIKHCKANYYLNINKNNVKNLKVAWNVVNELLGKNNKSNADLSVNLDCDKINEFFTSLGHNAIKTLPPKSKKSIKLNSPLKIL